MIEDGELENLPDDPELAFVQYERRLQRRLGKHAWRSYNFEVERDYVNKLLAFMSVHHIESGNIDTEPPEDEVYFLRYFRKFIGEIQGMIMQIKLRSKDRSKLVYISPEYRQQIHYYLMEIRSIIDRIHLPVKKREAIMTKLNKLADEVDRDRTRPEAWSGLALELADTGGEIAERLAPARKIIDSIANVFAKAKELGEQLGLPPGSEPKQIEGPKKQLPAPDPCMTRTS